MSFRSFGAFQFSTLSTLLVLCGCSLDASLLRLGSLQIDTPSLLVPTSEKPTYCFNSSVSNEIKLDDGTRIIGGNFSEVGYCTNPTFSYDMSTQEWGDFISIPKSISGYIYTIKPDGSGGYFIAGEFTATVGETTLHDIVHLNASGTISDWNANFTNSPNPVNVYALEIHNGILYVGGSFKTAGESNSPRRGLAAFDISTGALTSWNPGITPDGGDVGYVKALHFHANQLYAGGYFLGAGQNAVSNANFGLLNLDNNDAVATFTPSPNDEIHKIQEHNGLLYVIGGFSSIGGSTDSWGFAALDPITGAHGPWNWKATMTPAWGSIKDFSFFEDKLWVVGSFTALGGTTTKNMAAYDASGATPTMTAWTNTGHAPDGTIDQIFPTSGKLVIKGTFDNIEGSPVHNAAILNSDGSLHSAPSFPDNITNILFNGDKLIAGGGFQTARPYPRENLVMINSDGEITNWNPMPNNAVETLATDGTRIFVGGYFTTIGATPVSRNRLAEIDMNGNATSWIANANSTVFVLKYENGSLWAGGQFTSIGATPTARNFLAQIDSQTGEVTSWNAQLAGSRVNDFEIVGSKIVVGGWITDVQGDTTAINLVSLDTTTAVLESWRPRPDNEIKEIESDGENIFVGGWFDNIGSTPVSQSNIAKIQLSSDQPLSWNPLLDLGSYINMTLHEGGLTVSGSLYSINGAPLNSPIIVLDPDTGTQKQNDSDLIQEIGF